MPARPVVRAAKRPAPVITVVPRWFRPLVLGLSALFLLGVFSPETADSDFWWHLRTGKYLFDSHALPIPDPFAYTTGMGRPAYPGEASTRDFNLTHEWLTQAVVYLAYGIGGFPGVVLFRALVLSGFSALVGLIAWRRRGGFYAPVAAALATMAVAIEFAQDRPFIVTFLFLAATIAILEFRRWLWLLPPLFVIWSNCHGGYVIGWAALAAYSADALLARFRGSRIEGDRRLWVISGLSILASGLNPNGFHVIPVLLYYRQSFLTSTLQEWRRPAFWPPRPFTILLAATVAVMIWQWRRVRPVDWMLFALFGAAAVTAERNVIFIGFLAPILIAAYVPWRPAVPRVAQLAAAVLIASAVITLSARGTFFQLRVAEWKYPAATADFLLAHRVSGRLFNSYEYGGYLIWRLWPEQKVFIDGRALNESVFADYVRILYNHDETGGKSAQQLLDDYRIQVIVMNGFEYVSGELYKLAPALADPKETGWTLVFMDPESIVYMREPPPGVQPIDKSRVFDHLEEECALHMAHDPEHGRCARSLGKAFLDLGDLTRARRWLGTYLASPHEQDAEAERSYAQLVASGH